MLTVCRFTVGSKLFIAVEQEHTSRESNESVILQCRYKQYSFSGDVIVLRNGRGGHCRLLTGEVRTASH